MPSPDEWATFLSKIGLKITKKHVSAYIHTHFSNSQEVWDYYIESNELVKETVRANRIRNPDDIDAYFREVSYAQMRGLYPRRSHGRSMIIPRLLTIKDIEITLAQESYAKKALQKKYKIQALDALIGKQICHKIFGTGRIISAFSDRYIEVLFDNCGTKKLDYDLCVAKEIITVE